MTLNILLCAAAAIFIFGIATAAMRRSLLGILIGIELSAGALLLLAVALFDLSGTEASTGQVIAVAIIAFAVAVAVVVIALHLAAARASQRAEDLEPW